VVDRTLQNGDGDYGKAIQETFTSPEALVNIGISTAIGGLTGGVGNTLTATKAGTSLLLLTGKELLKQEAGRIATSALVGGVANATTQIIVTGINEGKAPDSPVTDFATGALTSAFFSTLSSAITHTGRTTFYGPTGSVRSGQRFYSSEASGLPAFTGAAADNTLNTIFPLAQAAVSNSSRSATTNSRLPSLAELNRISKQQVPSFDQ